MNAKFSIPSLLLVALVSAVRAESVPLAQLPPHLTWREDAFSIVADYADHEIDGRIPVYLINATSEDVELETQDGNPYLKLEYLDTDGTWRRAQAHWYGWCGNAWFTTVLNPCRAMKFKGYQPAHGDTHTIRYAIYRRGHERSSNAGSGLAAVEDIERARFDDMSITEGDFEFVSGVASGRIVPDGEGPVAFRVRERAVRALAGRKFDARISREILLRVIAECPEMREAAAGALKRLDEAARSPRE
jgi:hypothetical protein